MPSLYSRLRLAIFASTTIATVASSILSWGFMRERVFAGLDATLRARAELIGAMCTWSEEDQELRFEWPTGLDLQTLIQRDPCDLEIRCARPWRLVYRTGPELPRHGVEELLDGGPIARKTRARFHTLDHEPGPPRRLATILVQREVQNEQGSATAVTSGDALVKLAVGMQPEIASLEHHALLLGGLSLGTAVLLGCVAHVLAREIAKPLMDLELAARGMRPERATSLPRSAKDEEVNRLADALESSYALHREAIVRQARFSSNAAHELRNPLAAMRSSAEVALRRERSSEEYEQFFLGVVEMLERTENTVQALLEMTRLDDRAALDALGQDLDLLDLLEEACGHVDVDVRGRLVRTAIAAPPRFVHGVRRLLVILIGNLLQNAVQYSPAQTSIELSIDRVGDRLLLAIRDHGPGLSAEERERVFERFYRAPSAIGRAPGSGLGLSIARSIAECHGASLVLEAAEPGLRAIASFPFARSATGLDEAPC